MDGQEPEVVNTEEIQEVTEEPKVEPEVKPEVKDDITPKETDPKWYINKIGKMTGKLYQERAKNAELENELKKYRTERIAPKAPIQNNFINAYGDVDAEAYQKALDDYIDKRSEFKRSADSVKSQEEQYLERKQERIDVFNKQVEELKSEIPDIYDVIKKPIWSQVIGKPLEDAIYESDESAKLADYLGRNEAEVMRLNQMPVARMLTEIGKIEEKLAFQEKKSSKAAPPINPVEGNSGKVVKDINDISDDDAWFRERQKEKLRKLKGK